MTPISSINLDMAERALNRFVELVPDYYGVEHVSFNVHLLTHLVPSVRQWGPLWSYSAFFFEDANGKLLIFFHGTRGVAHQIFRSFIGGTHLQRLINLYITKSCTAVLDQIVNMTPFCNGMLLDGGNRRRDEDVITGSRLRGQALMHYA